VIASGDNHTCALLANGTMMCWGLNSDGELGNGTWTPFSSGGLSTPVEVSGLSGITAIALGAFHTCALIADGTVECWGHNSYRELGNGTDTSSLTPVGVSGLSGVIAISAGAYHSCVVLANGTAKCWGANGAGELGNGTTGVIWAPVSVSVLII
jgi:alpha-tubulin suppressor-like RCC1 family protein